MPDEAIFENRQARLSGRLGSFVLYQARPFRLSFKVGRLRRPGGLPKSGCATWGHLALAQW